MSDNQGSMVTATMVGTLFGGIVMYMMKKSDETKLTQKQIDRVKQRQLEFFEKKQVESLVKDRQTKKKRRVHLFFNNNDEMIEKEGDSSDEQKQEETNGKDGEKDTGAVDADMLKKKLEEHKMGEYKTKITVNLGSEEYSKGQQKITKDIFEGSSKIKNAELFIENFQKTK